MYAFLLISLLINLTLRVFGHHNNGLTIINTIAVLYLVLFRRDHE